MHPIQTFEVYNGTGYDQYLLCHIYEDDSRAIVRKTDDEVLLRIDSELRVTKDGQQVGRINSVRTEFDDEWALKRDGKPDVPLGAVRNYHWVALELAEIRAAREILGLH